MAAQTGDQCNLQKQDCQAVIDAAKKAIADRDQLIKDQGQTVTDLGISLDQMTKDKEAAETSRDAWYHNPFFLVPIGILIGGAGALYLNHK